MNILGKRIKLRAIEVADLPKIHRWSNDPEINYMLGGWHFPSSLQDQEKWYKSFDLNSTNQRFAIEDEKAELIGVANLVDINWKDRNAFHGMLLGEEDARGKGYGQDTILSICRYAFEELGLKRLDTSIISNNEPSLRVYIEKCGWRQDGLKKDFYFRKNTWWDRISIGITSEEYRNLIKEKNYWGNEG